MNAPAKQIIVKCLYCGTCYSLDENVTEYYCVVCKRTNTVYAEDIIPAIDNQNERSDDDD